MEQLNEELLSAWLRLSVTICNKRIVSGLSYNEAIVCNMLYHQRNNHPGEYLTATDLCNRTYMLKSLMNRTINNLEKQELVVRKRSEKDRRLVYVMLNEENIHKYEEEHEKIIQTVNQIAEKIGIEKIHDVIEMFNAISDAALDYLKKN